MIRRTKCFDASRSDKVDFSQTYVVLKSAQLLLADDVEAALCPGAGGGVAMCCWAEGGVAEGVECRLIGTWLSGILSA